MEFGSPARIWWLPESFYTLKNLKAVKLDHVMMGADGPVSLPSLKILQLRQVVIEDFEMLSKLISGCPALESLDLHDCLIEYGNENDILAASLPSLRNFKIYVDIGGELCDIEIEAPNLEHVVLLCFADVKFLGSSPLSCLHSARVDTGESRTISTHCLMGLLTQISNAKEMSLDWPTLESLLGLDDVQLPVFPHLTHLTIQPVGTSCILHSLLHSASKLQALVIDLEMADYPMVWEQLEPPSAPKCLLSSLEEIEIKGLSADKYGIKMVAYLLKAGAVLKKVNIRAHARIDREKNRELASLLRRLPKGSSACDVRLLHCSKDMSISVDDDDHEEFENEFDRDS
ncbi:unnamed protein product [Linum tenue]|uniref:FBD domain-containing protein n=1 Tax=Linum tenue TaxID=586396 RepID=A0AAV0P8D7_9ROSI|nr:unnamed protein product [Linum tenue]